MITREELLRMRNMTFDEINPDEVPDIDDLDIDVTKSKREKILEVLESGRNPYFVKSGNILVKIGFASTSRTIEEALEKAKEAETDWIMLELEEGCDLPPRSRLEDLQPENGAVVRNVAATIRLTEGYDE